MEIADPRIGLDFGDYKVTRKLAEGGMGAVYLAEHAAGMRKCVKFMLGEALKIPAIRKRFETECLAAKRFKGRSGIVEIDSFGERNGELYLVMEFLEGITLEDHIRQNVRLTAHHTFHVIVLCLRALSVLHGEGIIHRDLKPSNVFLRQTDERPWDPTLIDFGIVHDNQAKPLGEFGTREGQVIGTPGFMATEQFGRAHQVTPATDVFACAVIMWLMLTGELPWGVAENEYAQYDRQLHHRPVWPAHVQLPYAEGWKELLIEALSPDPTKRPSSAQMFALLLAQQLEPMPPHVPSGLEMITKLAPRFLQNLPPELETVRQPNGRIEVAAFWPPQASRSTPGRATPSGIDFEAIRVSALMQAAPVPASAPTVSGRPAASRPGVSVTSSVPQTTTISAASGDASMATPNSTNSAPRTRRVVLALGASVVVVAVVLGVLASGARSSASFAPSQPTASPSASTPSPAPVTPPTPATSNSIRTEVGNTTAPARTNGASVEPSTSKGAAARQESEHSDAAASTEARKPIIEPTTPKVETAKPTSEREPTRSAAKQPKRTDLTSATKTKPTAATASTGTSSSSTTKTAPAESPGPRAGSGTFDPDAIKE